MKQLDLHIRINVLDEPTFVSSAREYYRTAWQQELEADDLGLAALELIALSNMNPSPVDLGFEYVSYDCSEVTPSPTPSSLGESRRLACQNCEVEGDRSDFSPAKDVLTRIDVGEPFTDRECSHCGALAHTKNGIAPPSHSVMHMFLLKQDEYTSNLPKQEALLDLARLAMTLAMMSPDDAVSYANEVLLESQS